MFLADATVASGNDRYRVGDRHALIVFIRQPAGAAYDWENAKRVASEMGWEHINIAKAGKLDFHQTSDNEILDAAQQDAAENGTSIVVYATPINDT